MWKVMMNLFFSPAGDQPLRTFAVSSVNSATNNRVCPLLTHAHTHATVSADCSGSIHVALILVANVPWHSEVLSRFCCRCLYGNMRPTSSSLEDAQHNLLAAETNANMFLARIDRNNASPCRVADDLCAESIRCFTAAQRDVCARRAEVERYATVSAFAATTAATGARAAPSSAHRLTPLHKHGGINRGDTVALHASMSMYPDVPQLVIGVSQCGTFLCVQSEGEGAFRVVRTASVASVASVQPVGRGAAEASTSREHGSNLSEDAQRVDANRVWDVYQHACWLLEAARRSDVHWLGTETFMPALRALTAHEPAILSEFLRQCAASAADYSAACAAAAMASPLRAATMLPRSLLDGLLFSPIRWTTHVRIMITPVLCRRVRPCVFVARAPLSADAASIYHGYQRRVYELLTAPCPECTVARHHIAQLVDCHGSVTMRCIANQTCSWACELRKAHAGMMANACFSALFYSVSSGMFIQASIGDTPCFPYHTLMFDRANRDFAHTASYPALVIGAALNLRVDLTEGNHVSFGMVAPAAAPSPLMLDDWPKQTRRLLADLTSPL